MKSSWIDHRYFRTYAIAHAAVAASIDARFLEGLVVDGGIEAFLEPWQRRTALHRLVEYVADDLFSRDCDGPNLILIEHDWRNRRHLLPVDYALELYGIQDPSDSYVPDLELVHDGSADAANAAYEWFTENTRLSAGYDQLLRQLADEVFHVMFLNREALASFNDFLSVQVSMLDQDADGVGQLLDDVGRLARRQPPAWVRRAVYFREQGLCANCQTDLSGTRTPHSRRRFDHVIPLAAGGLNDVTNIQLLCVTCNAVKAADRLLPSSEYRRWFAADASNRPES